MPPLFYRCKCLRIAFFICKIDVFYLFTSAALAAGRDSTNIRIQVIQRAPLRVGGSLFTQDRVNLDEERLSTKKTIPIGSVKIQSKTRQRCQVDFSSQNDFKLTHSDTNSVLAKYNILLDGKKIDEGHPLNTDCDKLDSQLDLQPLDTSPNIAKQGYYEDTLSMVITTP